MAFPRREGGSREFYSGRELEADILGKPKFPKAYEDAYRRLASEKKGYLPYDQAQRLIREFYPEDPTHPAKEFARDLRLAICEALELDGEDADAVKFYSAVGTALDTYHGVDAWVEVAIEDARKRILYAQVTLDATLRTEKVDEGHKADVIVGNVPAPEAKNYLGEVEKYSQEVTELLFSRLQAETSRSSMGGRR